MNTDAIQILKLLKEHKQAAFGDSILIVYRGSIAHGMYVPNTDPHSIDDVDIMAVVVPPLEYFFGLKSFGSKGTMEWKHDPIDAVTYEIRKLAKLLVQANPNVLSLLWTDKVILNTPAGMLLRKNKELFSSMNAYHAFCGYAYGQLKRMKSQSYEGYMGVKRKEIVDEFGYDTKNAAHLIRLLRMGCEFLKTQTLQVDRSSIDAEELLEIKLGKWNQSRVEKEADRLFDEIKRARDCSTLPQKPDVPAVNRLCVSIVQTAMGKD